MFRHVALFRWAEDVPVEKSSAVLAELQALGQRLLGAGRMRAGLDAKLDVGNYDAGVVVDFESREQYVLYRDHAEHVDFIAHHLRPILAQRVAIQYDSPSD